MRARVLLAPLVMAAALLAGCATTTPGTDTTPTPTPTSNGVENLSANEILTKATEALKDASSFRAKGTGDSDGTKVELDLLFAGSDAKGTIKMQGLSLEIISLKGDAFVKAGDDFWKTFLPADQQAVALALVTGKWVKLPASAASDFSFPVDDLLKPEGTPTKGQVTTVNGQQAITLEDTDKGKLYISTTGEPYPIKIDGPDGTLEFVDIGKGETITAPSAAETVDLSKITG